MSCSFKKLQWVCYKGAAQADKINDETLHQHSSFLYHCRQDSRWRWSRVIARVMSNGH